MRDGDDLGAAGDVRELLRHHLGGAAADARVDLVKDIGGDLPGGHTRLDGEHEAAHLAAADDLVERLERLARVGGKEKAHRIQPLGRRARRVLRPVFGKLRAEAGAADVERPKLLAHAGAEIVRRRLARRRDRAADGVDGRVVLFRRRRERGGLLVAVGKEVVFLPDLPAIGKDGRDAAAVFLFEAADEVEAALRFRRVPLVEGQVLREGGDRLPDVLRFRRQPFQPLDEDGVPRVQAGDLGQAAARAVQAVHRRPVLGQRLRRLREGATDLFDVGVKEPLGLERLLLALRQRGGVDLLRLIAQDIQPTAAFRVVAAQRPALRRNLPPLGEQAGKFRLRLRDGAARRAVEQGELVGFAQKIEVLALAVDVHEMRRHAAEHPRVHGAAVDLAVAPPVRTIAAGDDQLLLRVDVHRAQLVQRAALGRHAEHGRDGAVGRPVADHRAVRLGAEHEIDAVQNDGLARTRLTGKDVQPLPELDLGALDERHVAYVQSDKHGYLRNSLSFSTTTHAFSSLSATISSVSSPAIEPTISGRLSLSTIIPALLPLPRSVLTTT